MTTISPETLRVTFGPVTGWNPKDPTCSVCAGSAEGSVQFGIAVDGAQGRICDDCAEQAGPFGAALVQVVEALDDLESAVHYAPAEWRGHLLDAAASMHNLLVQQ